MAPECYRQDRTVLRETIWVDEAYVNDTDLFRDYV